MPIVVLLALNLNAAGRLSGGCSSRVDLIRGSLVSHFVETQRRTGIDRFSKNERKVGCSQYDNVHNAQLSPSEIVSYPEQMERNRLWSIEAKTLECRRA